MKTAKPSLDSLYTVDAKHSRSIATSAGDFRLVVAREVDRILNERPGNQLKAAGAGLQRLLETKAITAQELKQLTEICQLVFSAQRGKVGAEEASAKIRAIYKELLADANASHVALAIASIAASGPIRTGSVGAGAGKRTAAANRSNTVDAGILGGAIGGAVIGGALGGFGGAVVGAVVGGIVAGIGTACAT